MLSDKAEEVEEKTSKLEENDDDGDSIMKGEGVAKTIEEKDKVDDKKE